MDIGRLLILSMVVSVFPAVVSQAATEPGQWPGWRGDGSGVSVETNLPLYWNDTEGVDWMAKLPGEGNSSPVVLGDRVFLTASTDGGSNRLVLCVDRGDGRLIWRTDLAAGRVPETYVKNGYASPTPVTDGERVYVFFDSPGLVALDLEGKILWTRDLGPFKNGYNMAASPALCGDRVVECCDQDEGSFIVALDQKTGEERWRTKRLGMSRQFATPLVSQFEGKWQIVVNGERVIAYDPEVGSEIWTCSGMRPNVSPSAVADSNFVYAVSGRNGPAMAIDPRGTGVVTETHVRMQVASGGPYVPSPLALPFGLLLPGDDGRLRLIGKEGQVAAELRVPGHYTASPVAGGSTVYWPNEKGQVAVVRIRGEEKAPRMELVAVNVIGGACLASPAIAGGKLFIRSDKGLYCIGGCDQANKVAEAELSDQPAELKRMFDEHKASEGPDVAVRIAIVEKLGAMHDVDSVSFLRDVALKDPHWDVGEAAAKSLGVIGKPAIPALIALMGAQDYQPYLKTIAADALGQLGAADATPALLKAVGDRNRLVRQPVLHALGRIAAANPADAVNIKPVLLAGLGDSEGTVRRAAVEALARNAGLFSSGVERDGAIRKLTDLSKDRNPLVVQVALAALAEFSRPVDPDVRTNEQSDVRQGVSVVRRLRAGPVRLKFQDGEIRYLCVGNREIVRRIYFAVRDERYDTVVPEFSEQAVEATADSFRVRLAARCSNDVACFSWTGSIVGASDGTISFQVGGAADRDFKPPRIGLNVLYGSESLAGQAYELVAGSGTLSTGAFPRLVAASRLSEGFRTLRYTTAEGVAVSVGLVDGEFGMEDQRNFGDSSYKAYSGMPFKYMNVKKGEKGAQTLQLEVKGVRMGEEVKSGPIRLMVGEAMPGAKLPRVASPAGKSVGFGEINENRAAIAEKAEVCWAFNVALHMADDDTFMENIPAVGDQVRTVRSFAAKPEIRISPVSFKSPYPRPGPDPRCQSEFGVAWTVRMMKQLGLAGVSEVGFDIGSDRVAKVLQELAKLAGQPLLATRVEGCGIPVTIDALAMAVDGKRYVWVVNSSDGPEAVTFVNDAAHRSVTVRRGGVEGESKVLEAGSEIALALAPFEVCILTLAP